ncbi:MAG: T9SS type B sorting domain-containing protein [Bacteroidia bacterium]
MKRALRLLFISLFPLTFSQAQTVFYTEDFSTAGAGWTFNVVTGAEGADPNFWKSSDDEGGGLTAGSCGVAGNGNNTLFVTSVANPNGGAAYDAGGLCGILFCPQADRRTESPVINCTGKSSITLKFNYIENGDATNDNATVWYNDGTGWVLLDDPAKTATCGGQGTWTAYSFALPASADNNPNVQIAFRWVNNDDGVGTDPSFAVDDITLSFPSGAIPVVSITPSPNDTICKNTVLSLSGSATNTPITSWAWTVTPSSGTTFTPDTTSQNTGLAFFGANPGTYTVTLFATNASGTGSTTQVITVLPTVIPEVAITPDIANPVCAGSAITFSAATTNGGASPSYQWQLNGANVGTGTSSYTDAVPGNGDVVSVIMISNATCVFPAGVSSSYTVQITPKVTPGVTVTPNNPGICTGSSVTFTATPANGGGAPSYQWILNGSNVGSNTSSYTLANVAGGELISVILASSGTCVTTPTANSNTVTVTAIPVPTVAVTRGTATVCPIQPDTLVAIATPGSTYNWTPASGLNTTSNDTAIAGNAAVGVYTYYVTATKNGCSKTDSVVVTVSSVLIGITAGPNSTICAGQSAPLSVFGGITWTWTPSGTTCDTCNITTATPSVTTVYTVTASNGYCSAPATETITVIPNASVSFSATAVSPGLPQTITFNNTSTNAIGYFWTFSEDPVSVLQTPPNHTYNAAGAYTVTLIAYGNNGCNDTLSTVIFVTDTVGIHVPNIFTPNGDEINDTWSPDIRGAKSFECTIFDRWGLKVYEFAGDQDKWDGHTTAGLMCQDGTYYYILKTSLSNNVSYNLKGYIQLIH